MSGFGVKRDEHRHPPRPDRAQRKPWPSPRTGAQPRSTHRPRSHEAGTQSLKSLVLRLARKAQISVSLLRKIESGCRAATPPNVGELAKALHVTTALNPEVIEHVRRVWGITIRDGFGQTETAVQVANTPGQPLKPGSMGRPIPGYDVVLLDPVRAGPARRRGRSTSICPAARSDS